MLSPIVYFSVEMATEDPNRPFILFKNSVIREIRNIMVNIEYEVCGLFLFVLSSFPLKCIVVSM